MKEDFPNRFVKAAFPHGATPEQADAFLSNVVKPPVFSQEEAERIGLEALETVRPYLSGGVQEFIDTRPAFKAARLRRMAQEMAREDEATLRR